MASSVGGSPSGSNYDVFINFRGPDTRQGFVDFLYEHMTLCGIRVFVDKERIRAGEKIEGELMQAICDSKICMLIFSKGYACSKWCLLELEEIMKGRVGQEVMPVFYDVTPEDVKLKTIVYSNHLKELEKEHGRDKVDRWRKCLKGACERQGMELSRVHRGKLISKITQDVLCKTRKRSMNLSNPLVWIDGHVKAIKELLDGRIDRVRFVIIHGMGGIGKTTLAKVIFNEVSSEFQGCSFLSDVRESSRGSGITKLQKRIMDDIFQMSVSIHNVDFGMNEIRERSRNKKVLLVLDDVDDKGQIQKLAGMFDWFGRGSRIIVTTRDRNVVPNELTMDKKVKMQNIQGEEDLDDIWIYKMREMDSQDATTLFKRHAFGADEYSFDDEELLQKIISLAAGLPLTLRVVGSHLFGQTKEVWKESLKMLEKAPHGEVRSVLMISYESLQDNEKELFLDIASQFRGKRKRLPVLYWESLSLYPVNGLNTLVQKSLIEILDDDRIWIHDQLRDLGREVVRRDGKHTRILEVEEALRLVIDKKGTSDTVSLNLLKLSESYTFERDVFLKLVNLRTLYLGNGSFIGDFSNCFKQIRWFLWSSFPSKFEAQNFSLPNLIILGIENTDIDENWTGWKGLLGSNLKVLQLSYCCGLTRTPNFSTCLGLQSLFLVYCEKLKEIDGSIGKLVQLTHLEIVGCANLKGLPPAMASLKRMEKLHVAGSINNNFREEFHVPLRFDDLKMLCHLKIECLGLRRMPEGIGQLKLLKYLSFVRCSNMTSLPRSGCEPKSLVELDLTATGIVDLSGWIGNMRELKVLRISQTRIKMLPRDICSLTKLEELNVSFSQHMEQIPSEIESLLSLRILDLQGTSIAELPSAIDRLSHLQCLNMESCQKLRRVGKLPASLSDLRIPYFSLEEDIPDLSNLVNLRFLSLLSNEASKDLRQTVDEEVNVNQHARTTFWDISWVAALHRLKRLIIEVPVDIFNYLKFDFKSFPSAELVISCSDAQSLSQLPQNLSTLELRYSRAAFLHFSPYGNLKNLSVLKIWSLLTEEIDLGGFESLVNLQKICLQGCEYLIRLSISSCPPKLVCLEIDCCSKLVDISGLDKMESLHELLILDCNSLSRLPDLSNLLKIKDLKIAACNSMERMPALPSTEHPINLAISDCRMFPDFLGPHNLFREVKMVGNFKGYINWILKIGSYCMRPLELFCLCALEAVDHEHALPF